MPQTIVGEEGTCPQSESVDESSFFSKDGWGWSRKNIGGGGCRGESAVQEAEGEALSDI